MFAPTTLITLDVTTLFFVATSITALLGLFLLFAWLQDRVRALAWWGGAYLIGGFSVAVWSVEPMISPPLPAGLSNALLFVACGMIWNAARLFHGCPIRWGSLFAGATIWLLACASPEFVESPAARIVLSSIIVSSYIFLTAAEIWRERRKRQLRRWAAIFVPLLHGAVFLFPIPLAGVIPRWRRGQPDERLDRGLHSRSDALCGRHRLHRAGAFQGARGPSPQGCRFDR